MTHIKNIINEKGWGNEFIYANGATYCGKMLRFIKGGKTSFHFHVHKEETLLAQSGDFVVHVINTMDASRSEIPLNQGKSLHLPPLQPHQIVALTGGTLLEVSSGQDIGDKYRVEEGSCQEQARCHVVTVEGDLGCAEFGPTPTLTPPPK
jgi:mannose-6-phosphate isomerase-like protein (cupin superfamily)